MHMNSLLKYIPDYSISISLSFQEGLCVYILQLKFHVIVVLFLLTNFYAANETLFIGINLDCHVKFNNSFLKPLETLLHMPLHYIILQCL